MGLDRLLEGESRYHRGVTQGLQFHMAPVLTAFEFHHNQLFVSVEAEEVDPTFGILPLSEFLIDHVNIAVYNVYRFAQQSLQVVALADSKFFEGGALKLTYA